MEKFTVEITVFIKADASKVWEALTNPEKIKEYLFGTKVTTDWKVGSPITYTGVWEGKEYEDKGTILKVEPGKYLLSTYWSGFSGLPDVPENYQKVGYALEPADGGTKLTLTQDNISSEKSRDHSAQNWKMVLEGLKKLVESAG